jgi:hypothetical protein
VFLGPQIFRWYSLTTFKFELEFEVKKSIRFDLDVQIPDKQLRFDSKGLILSDLLFFKIIGPCICRSDSRQKLGEFNWLKGIKP